MRQHVFAGALLVVLLAAGCVSTETHTKTVEELEAAKKASAAALEAEKK